MISYYIMISYTYYIVSSCGQVKQQLQRAETKQLEVMQQKEADDSSNNDDNGGSDN